MENLFDFIEIVFFPFLYIFLKFKKRQNERNFRRNRLLSSIEIKYSFSFENIFPKFKENIWKYRRKEIFEDE